MGRLLRKKPSFSPKKKGSGAEVVESSPAINSASANNTVASAAPIAVEKKRRLMAAQKPARVPHSYPGKEYFETAVQFLREVKVELRKVTWPSRKQTIGSTAVVIVLVMIIALFLGMIDITLSKVVQLMLKMLQ